ncbi:MAG: hypothetical protein JWN86_4228 [Planctomycetota bacterium]|nr:hypothetical protein [Planctomycetota bacterium]
MARQTGKNHAPHLVIKRIKGKGRGVFAGRPIAKDEIIERVPMLVIPKKEFDEHLGSTILYKYCFDWRKDSVALALGYGSLYNHSFGPNALYEDVGPQLKVFIALRDIRPGEEITINYNGRPRGRKSVEFSVIP